MTAPERDDGDLSLSAFPAAAGSLRQGVAAPPAKASAGLVACAAVAASLLSALILRNGIDASPDGWGYWEASISLLEGDGFQRWMGQAIWEWPPLFPAYLAAVQGMGRTTGAWICTAVSLLCAANAAAWGFFALGIAPGNDARARIVRVLSIGFVTVFVPLCGLQLLANLMALALVGVAAGIVVRMVEPQPKGEFIRRSAALAMFLLLALLTHHATVAFVAACAGVLAVSPQQAIRTRALGAGLALATVVPWTLSRWWLDQMTGHRVAPGRYAFVEYVEQSLDGIGRLFMSAEPWSHSLRIGAGVLMCAAVAGLLVAHRQAAISLRCRAALMLAAGNFLALLAVFSATWVMDPLSSRFLWQVPLIIVPVLLCAASHRPALALALAALLTLNAAVRTAAWAHSALLPALPASDATRTDGRILPWYFVSFRHPENAPSGTRAIHVPTYSWLDRWHRLPEIPEKERGKVRMAPLAGPSNATGSDRR
ncbi:MAG TPA: hypothetical protein VEL28_13485 [Candidatus Binatia bacterium]|nr:hypothetical protein [Candidatus Binatia bacterium]